MTAPPLQILEQRIGLGLSLVAAASFIALSGGRPLFLGVGLTMSVLLAVGAWRRNRVGAAFAAFVTTFGPWSFAAIFGAAYAVYALWILSRSGKVTEERRVPTEGTTAAPPGA